MNTLKRTLALVATLAMASTAFVGCGSSDSSSKKDETTTGAATTGEAGETQATTEETPAANGNSMEVGSVSLPTGGSKFTLACWSKDDVPALKELWEKKKGACPVDYDFICFDCGGGAASERYDDLFASNKDLDLYFAEADWCLKYINDDTKTAALEQLGFSDANFVDQYNYTKEIGKATEGANAGKMVGSSWQAAAGGFAYRRTLAKDYLGVETPEQMQEKVKDWDAMTAAATEVAKKSEGKCCLIDSIGGLWQVFAANRQNPWVSSSKRIMFDDQCKQFAEMAKKLWDNGGISHIDQWDQAGDWQAQGQKGACMGYFVSTWGFGEGAFFGQASSKSRGDWGLVQGPANYFWGGTWIVVNPKTDNADLCQSFILTTTVDQEAMKEYALSKPEYVNNKTAMEQIIAEKKTPEFVTNNLGGQNYFEVLNENVKSLNMKDLITSYDSLVKDKFIKAVKEVYLNGSGSYDDVLTKAMGDAGAANKDLAGQA